MIINEIFVSIFGLLFGSFINVCIYRIPRGGSIIRPGSQCTNCNGKLKAFDLIPVFSYLFLNGRCRYCGEKISYRYALIELLTAGIFLLLHWKYAFTGYFFATAFLSVILIAVFFIDLEHKIIPDGLVLTALAGGTILIIYNVFNSVEIYGDRNWYSPLLGMFSGSGILFIISLIGLIVYKSDGAMGMGDVKILAPIGVFLGWKMTLLALMFAIILGGITGLILIIFKFKNRKDEIPFGPFIVCGTYISLLSGWNILGWYLGGL